MEATTEDSSALSDYAENIAFPRNTILSPLFLYPTCTQMIFYQNNRRFWGKSSDSRLSSLLTLSRLSQK
jgi:hypothetical protein